VDNLELTRSLIVLDLETTGTDPATDRIVEISVLRISPDGGRESRTRRINPGRPIPPEATAVHGIRDEDVLDEPTFRKVARGLLEFIGDADLAGFNAQRFDIPLLAREFRDCGLDLDLGRRSVVDVMTIFHRMEPRDLSAAVRFYLGREHAGAHGAEADVLATAEVLDAQLARYPDLPRGVEDLDRWCNPAPDNAVDRSGKFVWRGGDVVFAFGKNQGRTLKEVARSDRGYLQWIAGADFPEDARTIVREAMDGRYPERGGGR
jgi:DNA polymerase-3 subunit epsilon